MSSSVTVSYFPSRAPVSHPVTILYYPEQIPVSTSVNISNYPVQTPVSFSLNALSNASCSTARDFGLLSGKFLHTVLWERKF